MSNPKVYCAVLCDDVRMEVGRKPSLMGLFTDFSVSDYQKPLPKFSVFLRLGFERRGSYAVRLEARSFEGDFSTGVEGQISAGRKNEASGLYVTELTFGFENLKVPREGHYSVDVKVDGAPVVQIPFSVVTKKPAVAN